MSTAALAARPQHPASGSAVGGEPRTSTDLTVALADDGASPVPRAAANRIAFTVIAVAFVALMIVLGLWQRVDAACEGSTSAAAACPARVDVEQSATLPLTA